MEANRIMNSLFSYLIKIQVGPHTQSMLVVNKKEVPEIVLETMAKEKISTKINELYAKHKDYRVQTSQQYFSRMIKQSDFQIEDLNGIEVYDLELKFENESVTNKKDGESKIFQSRFNKEEGVEESEEGLSDT